jgi:hypothetical protein
MELASDSEAGSRREFAAAAEAHLGAIRQFLLSRETSNREERERLRSTFHRTKVKAQSAAARLFASRSTL